tara:strand:- start:1062 stop:1433 length:372 start_codon:yes stop_codon:yes gene_type:complete
MINEIRMPNVYKVELRSPTKLKYQSVANWFRGEGFPLREVRGKFDTYWINDKCQVEVSVDSFYIGCKGDFRAYEISGWIFDNFVSKKFPFSNMRQVKTDIGNRYDDKGLDVIYYAKDRRSRNA